MTEALPASHAMRLLQWFDRHGRHDLPWQHPRTPYRVWLSEVMLQQTQVAVATPYFERFVEALPDLPSLAAAELDQVLALWAGLGYYARARNLHAAARICMDRHGGELPRDPSALRALPGIGRSTAGAIAAQAWSARTPIMDGNVKRALARLHGVEGWPGSPAVERRLWAIADDLVADPALPDARLPDYTQAQMDFGATLCTRHDPACGDCPLRDGCVALRDGRTAELPTPRPGKALPQRDAVVLVARDASGRVLLERRPAPGIWGGLWSLPEQPDPHGARAWFERHLEGDFDAARPLPGVVHGFSHFRLRMAPLHCDPVAMRPAVGDNRALRWTHRDEFTELGLPAPVRRLLESL